MTMQLSTIGVSHDLTAPSTTRSTNRDAMMDLYGRYYNVAYLQVIGGQLPGQVPFAVGLTVDGYYGITMDGTSMGSLDPLGNFSSAIEGVQDRYFRSRFRNHNQQVVPGYEEPSDLSGIEIFGLLMGATFGIPMLRYLMKKFDKWLEKIRLDDEKRAAERERESFELISKLRHVSGDPGTDPSSTTTTVGRRRGGGGGGEGGAGGLPFDSASANTTSHTLLNDLGLTRHPRPNTAIIIGDDEDELKVV